MELILSPLIPAKARNPGASQILPQGEARSRGRWIAAKLRDGGGCSPRHSPLLAAPASNMLQVSGSRSFTAGGCNPLRHALRARHLPLNRADALGEDLRGCWISAGVYRLRLEPSRRETSAPASLTRSAKAAWFW